MIGADVLAGQAAGLGVWPKLRKLGWAADLGLALPESLI
jgi:hypothetical protein